MRMLHHHRPGQTLVEYGLSLGMIALAAILVLSLVGISIGGVFSGVNSSDGYARTSFGLQSRR